MYVEQIDSVLFCKSYRNSCVFTESFGGADRTIKNVEPRQDSVTRASKKRVRNKHFCDIKVHKGVIGERVHDPASHERERIPNHETTHGPGHELCRQRCWHNTSAAARTLYRRLAHLILDLIDVRAPIQIPEPKHKLVQRARARLEPDAKLVQVDVAWADQQPVLVVDEHLLQVQVRAQRAQRGGGDVARGRFEEHDEGARRGRQHAVDVLPGLARGPVLDLVHRRLRRATIGHSHSSWRRRPRSVVLCDGGTGKGTRHRGPAAGFSW